MARQTYGNTWWGEQWLNALTHIDYDNRLPRGRTYANKGAVKDLKLSGGALHAKVQGSRPRPYQVSIQVPSLTEKNVENLLDALVSDPGVIARLLNGELDPSVLTHAQYLGIAIFPSKWKDLAMQCSCPDWAVPCKHLAAAIYLMSREIDSNPFLVFSLRSVDLAQRLKVRGIHIEREAAVQLPRFSALLATDNALVEVTPPDPATLDAILYASLPELAEPLLAVLPARPAFFPCGDLREVMQRMLARVAKRAHKALDGTGEASETGVVLMAAHRPHVTLSREGHAIVSGVNDLHSIAELDAALAQITPAALPDKQLEVAALYHVRLMALHLLVRGAVVPQVFAVEQEVLGLRWLPATLDGVVSEHMQQLALGLPTQLAVLSPNKSLALETQANALCALFLGHYLATWSDHTQEKPHGDKILALLFSATPQPFDGPGENAVGSALLSWLARYHLAEREYVPILSLDEDETGDFAVALAVQHKTAQLTPPVPLHTVLSDATWSQTRFGILQTVVLLAEFFPQLNDYLRLGAKAPIVIAPEHLPALLFDTLPALRLFGIRALLPKALERLLRPRLSMKVSSKAPGLGGSYLSADDILAFNWHVALGEHQLTRAEFEQLVNGATGVVRFRGEYVYLDPEEIARLQAQLGSVA